MKNKIDRILLCGTIFSASLMIVSCGLFKEKEQKVSSVESSYTVNGVSFNMVTVDGGTFGMGTRQDGRLLKGSENIHQVIFDSYAISQYPVSQELWEAVMGNNPSSVKGDKYPVDKVTLDDCKKFVKKLSKKTGVPFCIPTEAQWEYSIKNNYAKYIKNTKEWCRDSYVPEMVRELTINPYVDKNVDDKVVRTDISREALAGYSKVPGVSFRVAVLLDKPCDEVIIKTLVDKKIERENVCSEENISVGKVSFKMLPVKGGSFKMGATPAQEKYCDEDEKPAHEVSVSDFEMAETEVTVALWKEVMGNLPYGNDEKFPNKPVINVSWFMAQEFIIRLNKLSGRKFRLPTEAEWEYAAREGIYGTDLRFSGSDVLSSVAAYVTTTGDSKVQDVKKYAKNKLGIYDMSGNAWEWCMDRYKPYGADSLQNQSDELYVMRGGSAASKWDACRVSNRSKIPASNVKASFGFRLAL